MPLTLAAISAASGVEAPTRHFLPDARTVTALAVTVRALVSTAPDFPTTITSALTPGALRLEARALRVPPTTSKTMRLRPRTTDDSMLPALSRALTSST